MEFVHDEASQKENIFESIKPNQTNHRFIALDDEEMPEIPFEETPKS